MSDWITIDKINRFSNYVELLKKIILNSNPVFSVTDAEEEGISYKELVNKYNGIPYAHMLNFFSNEIIETIQKKDSKGWNEILNFCLKL